MEQFRYKAKDREGSTRDGLIEAVDMRQAAGLLHDMGLIVIKISPKKDSANPLDILKQIKGVGVGSLSNFTRQLSTMINAGLSLIDALVILEKQMPDPILRGAIKDITKDIQSGGTFASSLQKHTKIFSPSYISMIKAGEASGTLDQVLNRLSDSLEKQREFQGKVKGAFIYPIIILIAMFLVITIVLVFVVPRISVLYKDLEVELPFPTKVLMFMSSTLINFWWLLILIPIGGVFLLRSFRKTQEGRVAIDAFMMRVPVLGKMNQYTSYTELTRTLGSLVGSGVPILDALKIAGEVATSATHQEALKDAARQVEKGGQLSAAFARGEVFPPIIPQMIAVGEETGKLDEVLLKLSHYFEVEVEQQVKNLTAALEPFIMIFLGIMVAGLVVSIILPIYEITSSIN